MVIGSKEDGQQDGIFYWQLNENLERDQPWLDDEYAWKGDNNIGHYDDSMMIRLGRGYGDHGIIYAQNRVIYMDDRPYICQIRRG